MRIGVLGGADIAFRRFLPALQMCHELEYAGIASRTAERAELFANSFGGKIYESYDALLGDNSIDAVYIPLPPALHFEWGKKALLSGKHVLMEKPFTTSTAQTEELLALAEAWGLTVHENYMFLYHSQLATIKDILAADSLGDLRLIRTAFGFPKRGEGDFRYNHALGGGALLDCGGYPVRLALDLLGNTARVCQARLCQPEGYEVDLYGNAVLENADGLCVQAAFGMDNAYKCELEIWGSRATLLADRIFTAPDGYQPTIFIKTADSEKTLRLESDNSFKKSIERFCALADSDELSQTHRNDILKQTQLINAIREEGTRK